MRRAAYDFLSIVSFGAGLYVLLFAVRRLAASDYVGAALAIASGLIIVFASAEIFRFAISIWITDARREK